MYCQNLLVSWGVSKILLGLGIISHQTQSACNSRTPPCADMPGALLGPGDRVDKMSAIQTSSEDPSPRPPVLVGRATWRYVGRTLGVPGAQQWLEVESKLEG